MTIHGTGLLLAKELLEGYPYTITIPKPHSAAYKPSAPNNRQLCPTIGYQCLTIGHHFKVRPFLMDGDN